MSDHNFEGLSKENIENLVNILLNESYMLRKRLHKINVILDKINKPNIYDVAKNKLFTACKNYKCPVCYELKAEQGLFSCKHAICLGCHRQLNQPCCPMCRAPPSKIKNFMA
jgi:hypothetical protein